MSARWLRLVLIVATLMSVEASAALGQQLHDPGRALPERHARPGAGRQELRAHDAELVRAAARRGRPDRVVRLQRRPQRDGGAARGKSRSHLRRAEPGAERLCPLARREVRVVAGAASGGSALVVQPDEASPRRGLPRQADRDPAVREHPGRRRRAWLIGGGLRVTQTGRRRARGADREPRPAPALHRPAARRRVDGRAVGLAARTRGRRRVLVEEKDAVTTVLVASAGFLAAHPEVPRFRGATRS